jgi:hypothetical protein
MFYSEFVYNLKRSSVEIKQKTRLLQNAYFNASWKGKDLQCQRCDTPTEEKVRTLTAVELHTAWRTVHSLKTVWPKFVSTSHLPHSRYMPNPSHPPCLCQRNICRRSSSSSCPWRVWRVSCSLILKMKLVPPSLPRSSYVPSSFWSTLQCLFWYSVSVHPLYVL